MSGDQEYLAKPSGDCCLEGSVHDGEPRGTYTTLAGVKTYIAQPPKDKANGNMVLYFPDVWGFFPNGMLIVDGFADAGYTALALDYFRDDPVWKHRKDRDDTTTDPDFDYEAWKSKHMEYADECVPRWVDAVRAEYGSTGTKYACVGYCFGAPYVCNELAEDTVTAGAFAHPAFLRHYHFENLRKPLFLSCAETDHTFDTVSRRKAIDLLQAEKKTYHVQLFSGVEHGFALRGNMENPYERWVKQQSLRGIIDWFDFWLSK